LYLKKSIFKRAKKKKERGKKMKPEKGKVVKLLAEKGTKFAKIIEYIRGEGVAATLVKQTVTARYGPFVGSPLNPEDKAGAYRAYHDLRAWAEAIASYYELEVEPKVVAVKADPQIDTVPTQNGDRSVHEEPDMPTIPEPQLLDMSLADSLM